MYLTWIQQQDRSCGENMPGALAHSAVYNADSGHSMKVLSEFIIPIGTP